MIHHESPQETWLGQDSWDGCHSKDLTGWGGTQYGDAGQCRNRSGLGVRQGAVFKTHLWHCLTRQTWASHFPSSLSKIMNPRSESVIAHPSSLPSLASPGLCREARCHSVTSLPLSPALGSDLNLSGLRDTLWWCHPSLPQLIPIHRLHCPSPAPAHLPWCWQPHEISNLRHRFKLQLCPSQVVWSIL